MPLFIAQALRFVIIAIVQSAAFSAFIALLEPLMDKAKQYVKNAFGLSDDDAGTYIVNFVLDTAELAGLTIASLKTKLPLKVADKFGFTTRGWKRGALPEKVSTGNNAPGASAAAAKKAGNPSPDAMTNAIASARGVPTSLLKGVYSKVIAFVGTSGIVYLGFINTLDFATWNGSAYQSTFQKLFATIGLKPDEVWRKPKTVSDDVFSKIYSTYSVQNAYAINDPYKQQTVIFSREALLDLLDNVGSELLLSKGSASAKDVLGVATALVLTRPGTTATSTQGSAVGSTQGSTVGTSTPTVKVFTGVLSQGVLGSSTPFTARPDDLIESVQELQDATSNNLAAALASLPSSLSYELKIVSSVITREGFKITGDSHEIITGYKSDGTPKYKRVVNKFAVLNIFLVNEKGTRTKVRSVVLGPTNVLKFNPTTAQIAGIESVVKSNLVTSNTADISSVVTNVPVGESDTAPASTTAPEGQQTTPTPTSAPSPTPAPQVSEPYAVGTVVIGGAANTANTLFYEYIYQGGGRWSVSDTDNRPYPGAFKTTSELRALGVALPGGAAAATPAPSTSTVGANASTLSEWYGARGQALPSVASRGITYQGLGLGQASFYTGTAEQNSKLLNALKAQ